MLPSGANILLLGDPHCHILPEDEYVDWRTMPAFFDYRFQSHWVNGGQPVVRNTGVLTDEIAK
jgi:hypothetical protein